jgi:hypothetical protein
MVSSIADPKQHDCIRKNAKNAGLKKGTNVWGFLFYEI